MERKLYQDLLRWKSSPARKPLILRGARQVGKTWILKEFGKREYKNCVYINFDRDAVAKTLFSDYHIKRILLVLEAHSGIKIQPSETLVVFDEIQEAPQGIGVLKYFCEEAPDIHVIACGSLLGIALHAGLSFPVGKVDELYLQPMTFEEFLSATNDEGLAKLLATGEWAAIDSLREDYIERLQRYYFVGGMPEAVQAFANGRSLKDIRRIQDALLRQYADDMSKHTPPAEAMRIRQVWDSLIVQLAKENRKFIYGVMRKGARAKDFESAIQWLVDAGIVRRVTRVSKPVKPLRFYEEANVFKLYPLDVGLMGAMAETEAKDVLIGMTGFEEYKGAFTESYVLGELLSETGGKAHYHSTNDSQMEIDFVLSCENAVIPIEVKATENLRSKSLRQFISNHPELKGRRFSLQPYRDQDWMENIPLYGVAAFIRTIAHIKNNSIRT